MDHMAKSCWVAHRTCNHYLCEGIIIIIIIMPPSKAKSSAPSSSSSASKKDEIQQSKSPAEFFAEHQSIAGFDNAGKSLYTTIREFIENSLDACESVNILPEISISIEEMTQKQFNVLRGVPTSGSSSPAANNNKKKSLMDVDAAASTSEPSNNDPNNKDSKKLKDQNKKNIRAGGEAYFLITVRDNGCGMAHEAIPDLLGRVLSGSKYGVRQTRGKFGLGAKMALIWSKKSTGVPIKIKTSHVKGVRSGGGGGSLINEDGSRKIGPKVSSCVLDIGEY